MHANIFSRLCLSFHSKELCFRLRTSMQKFSQLSSLYHMQSDDCISAKEDDKFSETLTKQNIDEVLKDHPLRGTLKTLYMSKKYKVYTENNSETDVTVNNFKVKVYHSERSSQPFVVVFAGQKRYHVNPFPAFPRFVQSNNIRVPIANNVLFTRLDWTATFSLLPPLINVQNNYNSDILSLFGPPGIMDNFSLAMPLLLSVKSRGQHKSRIVYHEYHNHNINTVKSDAIKISMINIPHRSEVFKKVQTARNPFEGSVTGYIFENAETCLKSQDDLRHEHRKHSWRNFPTIESYVEYIEKIKSNKVESKIIYDAKRPATIAFVDLPDSDYFDEMLSQNNFLRYHKTESEISCIFHITPSEVFCSGKYKLWMNSFGSLCKHFHISERKGFEMYNFKSEAYRAVFHTIHPHFFPLHGNKHCLKILQDVMSSAVPQPLKVPLTIYNQTRRDDSKIRQDLSIPETYTSDMSNVIQYHLYLLKAMSVMPKEISRELTEISFPKVVVLGSGGSSASVLRASPSYLIQISEDISILLDCGTDTFDQLYRHYGEEVLPQILSSIKVILLSHKHCDHWMGLVSLLQEMCNRITTPYNVLVFLPMKVQKFLEDYSSELADSLFARVHFFPNEDAHRELDFLNKIARTVNLKRFRLIPVDHAIPTFGILMQCRNGETIVYSSDTLPMCESLIKEGKNADLLIHDSLYTDDESELVASFKMHSTMRGAVATAHHMKAKNVMLTHFSGKCDLLPIKNLQTDEPFGGQILYALDHLEISINHLKYFSHLHETLHRALANKFQKSKRSNDFRVDNDLVELYNTVSKNFSRT